MDEKEYKKQWYEANKERLKEQQKQYREKNREKILQRKKEYRENNKEKVSNSKKQWYETNKDRILENRKEYYQDNKERIDKYKKTWYFKNRSCLLEKNRVYRSLNTESIKKCRKLYLARNPNINSIKGRIFRLKNPFYNRARLLLKYNLSFETYEKLLEFQNNKCYICLNNFDNDINIDHDHKTEKVRGLLCRKCNLLLGYSRDNIHFLQRAISYLQKPPFMDFNDKIEENTDEIK